MRGAAAAVGRLVARAATAAANHPKPCQQQAQHAVMGSATQLQTMCPLGAWIVSPGRGISTTSAAAFAEEGGGALPAGLKELEAAWAKLGATSNLVVPEVPSNFLPKVKEGESQADGELFPVNFYTPHGVVAKGKFDQITLPGAEGYFGVKANHVPYIAQLKPGLVELHGGGEVQKFFVSGGFAFVHTNSITDVCVVEAAPLDHFDGTAVKTALSSLSGGGEADEFAGVVHRAAGELYQNLDSALEAA